MELTGPINLVTLVSLTNIYKQGGDIIEIVVKDSTGRRMDKFICNLADDGTVYRSLKAICDKYDIPIKLEWTEESTKPQIDVWKADREFKW